ncbi:unnamed protein product [Durusdinium trenchii]|uniref:SUI1 domain-containing protein n=1 Tax=Durusdinium trenchii TaxID=1381693 RepID=A0ABP0S0W0_9DINO
MATRGSTYWKDDRVKVRLCEKKRCHQAAHLLQLCCERKSEQEEADGKAKVESKEDAKGTEVAEAESGDKDGGYPKAEEEPSKAPAVPAVPPPFRVVFKAHDSYPPMETAVAVTLGRVFHTRGWETGMAGDGAGDAWLTVTAEHALLARHAVVPGSSEHWNRDLQLMLRNAPHYYPELSGVSLEDAKKRAEELGEKSKEKLLPGGKVKRSLLHQVTIRKLNRGGRKCVTSVAGLDTFSIKLDDVAKLFKKKFACGCAVVKGENTLPDTVDIQGDFEDEVIDIITAEWKQVPPEKISVLDAGNKKKGKGRVREYFLFFFLRDTLHKG